MKTILLKTLAVLLVVLTTTLATLARPAQDGPRGGNHPTHRELKAYVDQNVLPVVRQQRQKLEPQLATADKAQLAIYRTQLQELRERGKALRQSFRAAPGAASKATEPNSPRAALTEAQKQQLQQLRTESRTIMLSVDQLARKYESRIAQLTQEVQPQKEKWAADMQAIIAKNTKPELQEKLGHSGGHHHPGVTRFFRPAKFLLLAPSASAPVARALGGTSLYPNPVAATSQLDYTVTKAGPVTVELLDGRGNTLRPVAQEVNQEKGPHTLQVNLADLAAGTYYYKITTRAGSETKRFVKE